MENTKKIMSVISRVIYVITSVTLVVCLLLLAVLVLAPKIGIERYTVLSGSMEPTVHTGAIAFIDTDDTDCEVGDIITYRVGAGNETRVTHRVIRIEGDHIYTKGDANNTEDLSPITQNQIVGTYKFQIPLLGYILEGIGNWVIIAFILIVFLLNIIFSKRKEKTT